MSLKILPTVSIGTPVNNLVGHLDESALSRWTPTLQAATEGDGSGSIISIYDTIGADPFDGSGVSSKRVAAALRSIGNKPVTVNINSPGGDFFEGVAIYNLLAQHPEKVTVNIVGLAASAASVIAMSGDDILMSKVGFVMIHNSWVMAMGNKTDLRAAADFLEPFDQAMAELYAAQTGEAPEVAAAWMEAETWFSGTQAVEAGLATGFVDAEEIVEASPEASASILKERRAEMAFRSSGMSAKEAKGLVAELKGTPRDESGPSMRDAGTEDIVADLRSLIHTIGSGGQT